MSLPAPPFPDDDAWRAGTPAQLMLAGPAGPLEAIVEAPDPGVPAQPVVAVFCHPLPTEGGTMHNKVVTMGCRALRELGVTTLRFNFRGVGASAGAFDDGRGELADLQAVVGWLRAHRPGHALWLAGFSFGAYVTLRAAASLQPRLLISVAPPAGRRWDFDGMPLYTGPWLVVQGEADEVVEPEQVYRWLERMAELRQPPALVRIPDTSHFFHGRLMDLRGAIRNGARPHLPMPAAHG
ncbi:MAG: alpha/beta hydrolase [Pseudomonadota bacterium]